jgi:hypothetical protein
MHLLPIGRAHATGAGGQLIGDFEPFRHRGLDLGVPDPGGRERVAFTSTEQVRRRDVLGGLIHEYDMAA